MYIINVKFDMTTYNYGYPIDGEIDDYCAKEYCFYSDVFVDVDDIVVVDSTNFYALGKVTKILNALPNNCEESKMKWVVDKVNTKDFITRHKKQLPINNSVFAHGLDGNR